MGAGVTTVEASLESRDSSVRDDAPAAPLPPARWVELVATGALSVLLFPLSWAAQRAFGLDAAEYAVGLSMFWAAHVVNDPHFAVTYLLFYRDARGVLLDASAAIDRRLRYALAGVVTPLALGLWAVLAFVNGSAALLGWMIQLMFLLVGWHYAKQGFGVLTVLSARRGVRFSALERRVVLAHCYAGWAHAWSNPHHAAGQFEEKGVLYWAPAVPEWLDVATRAVFFASALWLALTLFSKWRREGRLPWLPLSSFLVTIWLWTVYTRFDPLVRYLIPALHSLQYLYFVALLRGNEARAHEGPPHFAPPAVTKLAALAASAVALGYLLFRGAPALFDASAVRWLSGSEGARDFGATPVFAALFAFVNLHHYVMDAVIWRRDNPDMRYLHAR